MKKERKKTDQTIDLEKEVSQPQNSSKQMVMPAVAGTVAPSASNFLPHFLVNHFVSVTTLYFVWTPSPPSMSEKTKGKFPLQTGPVTCLLSHCHCAFTFLFLLQQSARRVLCTCISLIKMQNCHIIKWRLADSEDNYSVCLLGWQTHFWFISFFMFSLLLSVSRPVLIGKVIKMMSDIL